MASESSIKRMALHESSFMLQEKRISVQVSPGLGGVSVTKVRPGGAAEAGGIRATDKIVGIGEEHRFGAASWVESRDFQQKLSACGRPVKVRRLFRIS